RRHGGARLGDRAGDGHGGNGREHEVEPGSIFALGDVHGTGLSGNGRARKVDWCITTQRGHLWRSSPSHGRRFSWLPAPFEMTEDFVDFVVGLDLHRTGVAWARRSRRDHI